MIQVAEHPSRQAEIVWVEDCSAYEAEKVEVVLASHPLLALQARSSLMRLACGVDRGESLDANVPVKIEDICTTLTQI